MRNTLYHILIILVLVSAIGAGCSGGGTKDPFTPDPTGQQQGNPNLGSISGRVVDLEGTPVGGVFVDVQLFDENMDPLSAVFNPAESGPITGEFSFQNLPLNTTIILRIESKDVQIGRLIGYDRVLNFTGPGHQDLGDCMMGNEQLTLAWAAYGVKKFNLALYHFDRALNTRYADALTMSSSAYTGIGWVHAKRGRDASGTGPGNEGYEWSNANANFTKAIANPNDADAWVGMAGTYMTLVGNSILFNPDMYDGAMFIYGFLEGYQGKANDALDKALTAAPNYKCAHDIISADDLKACKIYNKYLLGESVTQSDIDTLMLSDTLNVGSLQLLTSMADIIAFDAYPKL